MQGHTLGDKGSCSNSQGAMQRHVMEDRYLYQPPPEWFVIEPSLRQSYGRTEPPSKTEN